MAGEEVIEADTMIAVSRRPPHLAFLCVVCVLAGGTIILSGPAPGSIEETLVGWQVSAWAWTLLICGAAILYTMFGTDAVQALKRERLMLYPFSLAAIAYASAVMSTAPERGAFAAGITLAFAFANLVRAWQITRWLRSLRARPRESSHG